MDLRGKLGLGVKKVAHSTDPWWFCYKNSLCIQVLDTFSSAKYTIVSSFLCPTANLRMHSYIWWSRDQRQHSHKFNQVQKCLNKEKGSLLAHLSHVLSITYKTLCLINITTWHEPTEARKHRALTTNHTWKQWEEAPQWQLEAQPRSWNRYKNHKRSPLTSIKTRGGGRRTKYLVSTEDGFIYLHFQTRCINSGWNAKFPLKGFGVSENYSFS